MRFRLESWEIDTERGRIRGPEGERRPEPTVLRLLEALVERPGTVRSRRELVETVWEGRYVTQGALTVAVCGLRRALGDDPRRPRFIRTHPGRGYQLVAQPTHPSASGAASPRPHRPTRWIWISLATLLAALLGLLAAAGAHPH